MPGETFWIDGWDSKEKRAALETIPNSSLQGLVAKLAGTVPDAIC